MDIAMAALRSECLSSTAFSFDTAIAKFGRRGSAPGKIVSHSPTLLGILRSPRQAPLNVKKYAHGTRRRRLTPANIKNHVLLRHKQCVSGGLGHNINCPRARFDSEPDYFDHCSVRRRFDTSFEPGFVCGLKHHF